MRGRLDVTLLDSRVLRDNPLGDPSERELLVYVPPGYDDEPERRYPVVMVLPGFGSNHRSLVAYDVWKPNLVQRFERLLASGVCAPALLVMPDAITRWGGSQFVDSAATGRYQTYLADEIFPEVDRRYRTIPSREGRAVIGRSSGGFGALRLGMDRPDVVSAIASHAGDAAFEVSLRPMFTSAAIAYDRAGGVEAFSRRILDEGPSGRDYDPLFFLAAAAAYAPEPDSPPPHAALPFDARTAELLPDVWRRWLAHDPVRRIDASASALRDMRLVFLDSGDADEHGLQFAARQLADAMRAVGVDVVHEEFPGTHRGTGSRFDESLPRLVAALAKE